MLRKTPPPPRYTFKKDPVMEYFTIKAPNGGTGKLYTRKHDGKVFLSIYLTQSSRNQGVGFKAIQEFMGQTKHKKLYAETRKSNKPMRRVFTKLGWKEVPGQRQALYTWSKSSIKEEISMYTREELIEAIIESAYTDWQDQGLERWTRSKRPILRNNLDMPPHVQARAINSFAGRFSNIENKRYQGAKRSMVGMDGQYATDGYDDPFPTSDIARAHAQSRNTASLSTMDGALETGIRQAGRDDRLRRNMEGRGLTYKPHHKARVTRQANKNAARGTQKFMSNLQRRAALRNR